MVAPPAECITQTVHVELHKGKLTQLPVTKSMQGLAGLTKMGHYQRQLLHLFVGGHFLWLGSPLQLIRPKVQGN